MEFSINELYTYAFAGAQTEALNRIQLLAILFTAAMLFSIIAAGWKLGWRKRITLPIILIMCLATYLGFSFDRDQRAQDIGEKMANVAITEGVNQARKFQATEEQYIIAPIVSLGKDTITCRTTVNYHGECQSLTGYYTWREINIRWVDDCWTDSDGDKHCTKRKESDDEYTPWFTHIERTWIVLATKSKYLDSRVYPDMLTANPDAHPKLYLTDWRAPEDAMSHVYFGQWPGQYNDHVPEIWKRAQLAMESNGPVVNATVLGKYFNWGFASQAVDFQTYTGQYRELKALVNLPGPSGAVFTVSDDLGQPLELRTTLTSQDGELALDYNPVEYIGFTTDARLATSLNQKALELQGDFGPHKEAIAKWFLVSDWVVTKMGGLNNVTRGLKGFLDDESVWGKFRLPKNQVIMVASISDDGKQITGRDMETGMPYGNRLVAQRMRLSIPPGESLPFTVENLLGNFSGRYSGQKNDKFSYEFTTLSQAGAAIGLLYEETPNWTPPDPNSDECSTAPDDHYGFIRYQMCTQQWRESNIQINKDGALLISEGARQGAREATPIWYGWVLLVVSTIALGYVAFTE